MGQFGTFNLALDTSKTLTLFKICIAWTLHALIFALQDFFKLVLVLLPKVFGPLFLLTMQKGFMQKALDLGLL